MSFSPANSVAWMEIPVRDIDHGIAFYKAVFDYDLTKDETGPNPRAMFPNQPGSVSGHIYPGEPARPGEGPTIHLNVPDTLEATAERVAKSGGTVVSDPIPLPMGRFQYVMDPDGNSLGLFELNAA
ncbi:MAG: VOC family protein [Boseongicola sp.]|nr:VOC family protein [Boseongicola sp.]